MRKIQKTFSLEPMTSRMPSVLPAYKDNELYYFDDNSLKEREYQYPSNYGMIPLNLRLSGVTFVDGMLEATSGWSGVTLGSEQCFCDESGYTRPCNASIPRELSDICEYTEDTIEEHSQYNDLCSFTLSFERLSKWYYFFKEYYHLLNDYGHCNRTYSSAAEYYYYESGERYADQMIYGTNEQTYKDLDAEFESKGGKVDIDNIKLSGATDIGFYRWICENIVPSYYISKDYAEYWKRTKLYYPDVIKWIAWFRERSWYELNNDGTTKEEVYTPTIWIYYFKDTEQHRKEYYDKDEAIADAKEEYPQEQDETLEQWEERINGYVKSEILEREHWDCKQEGFDCCDCEEYFNRGGKREFDRMMEWYNRLQDSIHEMYETISSNTECFIPTMDDKIQLHNSLDDLGQYSIFSKEYELGIDYRTHEITANTSTNTVVNNSRRAVSNSANVRGTNGYTSLEYIEGDGDAYIDTNYIPTEDTGMYVKASSGTPYPITENKDDKYICGLRQNTGKTRWCIGNSSNGWYYGYGSTSGTSIKSEIAECWLNYKDSGEFKVSADTAQSVTLQLPSLNFIPTKTIRIFGSNGPGDNYNYTKYKGKIYKVEITEDSETVLSLKPVKRNSDGAVGMYDSVSRTFFSNSSGGSFTPGPEIIDGDDTSENTHGGTVAEVSGNTMILNESDGSNEYTGFKFSPYYMRKEYDENAWGSYTDKYIGENSNEFIANEYKFYAFDEDNVMYTGMTSDGVESAMSSAYKYDIIETDGILIDGVLYPIEKSEYGIYDKTNNYIGNKTFFVKREKDTSTPYTLINGKKIYAEWYPYSNPEFENKPCYYFTFFKSDNAKTQDSICGSIDNSFNITNYKPFGRNASFEDSIGYISYMGQIFEVKNEDETLTIGNNEFIEYPRIHGYSYDRNNMLMYIKKESDKLIAVDSETLTEVPKSRIEGKQIIIGLDYEPHIYNAKELVGTTLSKLTDLESTDVLIDDVGNKIDGRYNPNGVILSEDGDKWCVEKNGKITVYDSLDKVPEEDRAQAKKCYTRYNHQPPQGEELDLLYEVGNTANIRRFKLTAEELSDISGNTNYFVGDILTAMKFYYKDVNGNVVESTVKDWKDYLSSLLAISASTIARNNISATTMFDGDDIYCDVTYYIGATLSRESGATTNTDFRLAYSADVTTNNYNYGVEYNETVKFVKENREYYLKKPIGKQIPTTFNSVSAHSVSYPVYVYKLEQELVEVEGDVYNTLFQSPLANFKTEINLINDVLSSNFSNYKDMDKYNNIHVTPTFKEEHMLGISSLENIDSDIYIERGINAAFEKHLKLGEVTSLEALEQYGLTFFKIIDG